MARSHDPIRLGRRFISPTMYALFFLLRLLSCAPCLYKASHYLAATIVCFQTAKPPMHCAPDTLLPALWALVSAYMTYVASDGMMVRWIVTYSAPAAIIRMFASVLLNLLWVHFLGQFNGTPTINLQMWVLISCVSTAVYILHSFIASNMASGTKDRTLNLFRIAVYAVVPVGLASFVSMIGLIRTVMLMQFENMACRSSLE